MTTTQHKLSCAARSFWSREVPPGTKTDLLILAAFWCASLLIVWPVGNFPLNDDWAFGRSVKRLLQTGTYYPTPWAAMPLLTQTLGGALLCLPGGFSFNALRCWTLLMSSAGILFTYFALRYVHPSRLIAVVGALTLAFNPIYYALSCTFMTDVTFTGLMMGSALFFFRYLRSCSNLHLWAGAFLALAATLCRQLAVAIPLSFALCVLWVRGFKTGWWARAIAPLLLCVGGLVAYQLWLKATGRLPAAYEKMNLRVYWVLSDLQLLLTGLIKNAKIGALHLGWFALPASILFLREILAPGKRTWIWLPASCVGVGFILLFADELIHLRPLMPSGNILVPQGIGPMTLNEAFASEPSYLPSIGKPFWFGVTVMGVLGGAFLLTEMSVEFARCWRRYGTLKLPVELAGGVFFLVSVAAYLFTILAIGGWDRYYMPALPLLLVGTAALPAGSDVPGRMVSAPAISSLRPCAIVSAFLIAFVMLFSVTATHDYLNWNRARWRALNELIASGKATPEDVDGGFEFNGWYLYDPEYKAPKGKNFWWVHGNDYMVAFAEQPGYLVIKEYPYSNWLPPRRRRVLLLGKVGTSVQNIREASDTPARAVPKD